MCFFSFYFGSKKGAKIFLLKGLKYLFERQTKFSRLEKICNE
jgi:hypothetical protein